jgi:type IV pilus assembly protein PilN
MIRVNLVSSPQERVKRDTGSSLKSRIGIVCSGLMILTAAGIGWWYQSLSASSAQLDRDIAGAQQESIRLRAILQQVRQFEEHRVQLQQRVSLIEQLRKGQTGPVRMLDEISRSLPELLWLTELTQEDSDLTIKGRGSSLTSLSDFVGNLERSTSFKRPVEILESKVQSRTDGDLIEFSIKAQLAQAGSPGPASSAAASRK